MVRKMDSRQKSANPKPLSPPRRDTILLPRRVVYWQGALLAIVALTFFVLGMMFGRVTGSREIAPETTIDCSISGRVMYIKDGESVPDQEAVIFLLPRDRKPERRSPADLVSPASFRPLDNPGIEMIHELGGAVVRADATGRFNVVVDGSRNGIQYFLLVVSRNRAATETQSAELSAPRMTKEQVAIVGTFFLPVDRVIEDRSFHWQRLTASIEAMKVPEVLFD